MRSAEMIIHNQVSENVISIGTIIIGVNIIVSMNNIANVNHHKTKLMKNNQTAFGSSCFIVYEFNDFNRKADDLSLSHYNTFLSTHMIKRIKKFSSPKMRNREFVFTPKIEYKLVAESAERADKLREANQNSLTFPFWCPRQESNLDHELRKLAFYPLNDEGRIFEEYLQSNLSCNNIHQRMFMLFLW